MNRPADSFPSLCRRAAGVASLVFIGGSLLISEIDDHIIPSKELFYSWLLVFINAYIGIFIANQAIKKESEGFFAWALLGNAVRAGLFLGALLAVVKLNVLNVRGLVLMTMFGYFSFLTAEIYGLHMLTSRTAGDAPGGKMND